MLRFLRTRALPPVHAHLSFSTKSPPTLPERARIALVGRTNVGKSTLFNRLTKTRGAIVHNVPGTTRDRRFAVGYLAGLDFDVIDTGGLADAPSGSLERGMLSQTERALHEADLILFLIDGREGVTEIDKHFARYWEPLVISAEHGEGLTDLVPLLVPLVEGHAEALAVQKAALAAELPAGDTIDELENVSTLSVHRQIVIPWLLWLRGVICNGVRSVFTCSLGPSSWQSWGARMWARPGVTRDAVEVKWAFHNREITLVDTAGIRKFSKRDHSNQIENLSVRDTYDAISSAQVVCVVVDVSEKQLIHLDLTIAQRVLDEGRALVLVANKADLVDDAQAEIERIRGELDGSLAQVRGVPIVSISALEGKGIRNILPEVVAAHDRWDLRVTTGRLNRWMAAMDRHHPPPTVKGKTLKVKYITQVKARPPTFALFVNKADDVPESFLLNQLRTEFDMTGVPARLLLRGSEDNPYKRGYSRAKLTTTTRSTSKPVAFGGRNTSPKAAAPAATGKLKAVPAPWTGKKVPTAKAKVVVRGTRKNKTSGFRGPSSGAKPKNGRGAASRPSSRREPTKKPSSAARGSSSGGRRPAEAASSKGRSSSSSRPSSKPSGGGGKQKGKSSGRHKTERTKLRDPSAKKASRWSDKQKENAKRHNGTRKPRTG
ncbi:hypothetical protein DYB38_000980 [Aphanomyces astaci]|uniref:GTPase Der n=1 Tax=Aphanomyces astaci TaxID=112090 RepID=A0A397D5M7_APHAT|nr:hypothetical protein DYB38_000980 [Aphanomyces astaci]